MAEKILASSRVAPFLMLVLLCCQCDASWRFVAEDLEANQIDKKEHRYRIEHEHYELVFRALYIASGPRVLLTILSKKDNLSIHYGNAVFKSLFYDELYYYPHAFYVRTKYQDYSVKVMNFRPRPKRLAIRPKDGKIIFKEKDIKVEYQTSTTRPWKEVSRKKLFETQTLKEKEQMEIQYYVFGFDTSKFLGFPDHKKSNFMMIWDILNDGKPLKVKFQYDPNSM